MAASGSAGNFQSIPALTPDQVPIPTTAGSVNMYMNLEDNLNIWTVDRFKVHRPVASSTGIKQVSFTWDFAVDGGTIGNYPTGAFIPAGAGIIFSIEKVYTAIDDGGVFAANHHLGYIGNLTFLDPIGSAFWGIGSAGIAPGLYGSITPFNSIKESTGAELIFSIDSLALTSGKFTSVIYYQEFP